MLYNRRVAKAAQEGLILLECRAIMLYKSKQSDIQVAIACSWGSCERLFLFCTVKVSRFQPLSTGPLLLLYYFYIMSFFCYSST